MALQFTVKLDDQPTALAELLEALAQRGVDLRSIGMTNIDRQSATVFTTNRAVAYWSRANRGTPTGLMGDRQTVEAPHDFRGPIQVWGSPTTSPSNASACVTQERRHRWGAFGQFVEKLGDQAAMIETVHGTGYRLRRN
jgi:hypothetical protein